MRRKISVTIALVICLLVTLAALSACVTDDSSDAVVSIAVNNFPESAATVYQGDGLSLENCSIIVNYESGNRSVVDMDDEGVTVTGFSPNTVGTQTVTLTYRGKSVNVEVTVLAIQVTDVFISARPDEISVVEGGALDVTGVSLSIRYQNGKSVIMEKITTDMVTGYSTSLKAGEYVVYVNYYGFSLPLDIVVKSKTLTSVSVLSTPGKTSYFVGDAILLTGLELKLNYDNGTEGTVAWSEANKDDFIVEYDFSYANGRSNVAITYGGKYTSFIVSVVNPSCKSVEIITAPVTVGFASTGVQPSLLTHVVQGDKINWATGKARITYDNGYTEELYMDDSAFYLYVNGTESANYIVDKTNYTFDVAGEVTAYIRYASNNFFTPISVSVFEKQAHTMFVADARPSADRINEKIFAQGTVLTTGYLKYNILYNNETWEFEYGDGSGSGWGQLTESMLSDGSVLTLRYNAATETGSGYSVQTISFTAGGKEASFLVKVAKPVAYRLDVSFPYKSVYHAGVDRELDLTGTSLYAELNTNEQVSYSLLTADFVSQYGRYYVMNGGEQGVGGPALRGQVLTVGHHGALLYHGAGHQDGVLDIRALLYGDRVEEHRVLHHAVYAAAAGDQRVGHLGVGAGDMGRLDGSTGIDGPAVIIHADTAVDGQHIHVGIPQGVDGTYVLPIAVETVGHQLLAGGQHVGDDVLAEVVGGVGIGLVVDEVLAQLLPGEHVDAHGGQGALGMLGLLLKLVDLVVLVHVHDAEAGGLLQSDLQHGDGAGRLGLLVEVHHVGVVHLIDMVAGQDDHVLGVIQVQEPDVLIDGVGRALIPGALVALTHVGGQNVHAAVGAVQVPGLAGADVAVQLQGTVLGQHANGINTGIDAVRQGKIDDAVLAAKRDGRLGHMAGKGIETTALTASQKHGHYFFFHTLIHLCCILKVRLLRKKRRREAYA